MSEEITRRMYPRKDLMKNSNNMEHLVDREYEEKVNYYIPIAIKHAQEAIKNNKGLRFDKEYHKEMNRLTRLSGIRNI